MTFAVPFDGSRLSEAALGRADEYARALGETVTVLSVVSIEATYAMEKGWIDSRAAFDIEGVARRLWAQARELVPDVDFEYHLVGPRPPSGEVAKGIKTVLGRVAPAVVFLGSDNAGRIVTPISSVGGSVSSSQNYDVYLVRNPKPSEITALDTLSPFYERTDNT